MARRGDHWCCYAADTMSIKLNHTIVYSADKQAAATFLTDLFGLPDAVPWGPFLAVEVGNEVTLDFYDGEGAGSPQHYAFLVGEDEFDQIFGRITERGTPTGRIPATACRARSIRTTAGAASTSTTRAGTSSRSSRGRTASPGSSSTPLADADLVGR